MRLRFLISFVLLVLMVLPGGSIAQTSIVVDKSPQGDTCYLPIVNGPGSGRFYILVLLGGLGGITGAEFRVTGMPPQFFVNVTPNPAANISLGNPLGTGCDIAFPNCQTGTGGVVLLYTVDYFVATNGVTPFTLQVEQHATPSSPAFPCPLVVRCDPPDFTKVCVHGGRSGTGPILAVPSDPVPEDGAPAVPADTQLHWSRSGFEFCCGIGTPYTQVYFGTTTPPPLVQYYDAAVLHHDPGPLEPLTTYYWRIVETPDGDCQNASGPIWSFTTDDLVGTKPTTWHAVKAMFR